MQDRVASLATRKAEIVPLDIRLLSRVSIFFLFRVLNSGRIIVFGRIENFIIPPVSGHLDPPHLLQNIKGHEQLVPCVVRERRLELREHEVSMATDEGQNSLFYEPVMRLVER